MSEFRFRSHFFVHLASFCVFSQYCRLFGTHVVIRPCVLPEEAYHSSSIFLYQVFRTPVFICSCILPEEAYHFSYILYLCVIIHYCHFGLCWREGELCGSVAHASPSHPRDGSCKLCLLNQRLYFNLSLCIHFAFQSFVLSMS